MIYLGADKGWVRMNLVPTAVGDPVGRGGQEGEPVATRSLAAAATRGVAAGAAGVGPPIRTASTTASPEMRGAPRLSSARSSST